MPRYTINRSRSISEQVERLLNDQYRREVHASFLYLSIASWAESQGFDGAARFFYAHAKEEWEHSEKLFKYINQAGGRTLVGDITNIEQNFGSLYEVVYRALDHEIGISQAIVDIVVACNEEHDVTTAAFLGWFLDEQREEEGLTRRACAIAEQVKGAPQADYLLDQQLSTLHSQEG